MTSESVPLDKQLAHAVGNLRSYTALIVVGAGLSAGRYPMTAQLPALVWHAIENSPEALSDLRQRLSRATGSAKGLLSLQDASENLGWELLRTHASAMGVFKKAFVAHDADADPSDAHYALARLIHEQRVVGVVSYNWDTCLERAYEQLFGVSLPAGVLYKLHGNAADPDGTWVLPDEDGLVTDDVLEHVRTLSDRPHVLAVVGYSGSDAAVVAALLDPLEQRWPVVRIGPSATGMDAVSTSADQALRTIADALAPRETLRGWRYVNFSRSRGFEAALRGERLGPADVDACPEFPAAERLANRLSSSRFATVSGQSGTGKSITAFHAARRMNQMGWQVVALSRAGVASLDEVTSFRRLPGRVLAVVDDAQAISEEVRTEFEYAVDDSHAVLLVSTQRLEARDDELLTLAQGARTLHDFCTANLETISPLLMELDDRVRWSYAFETPPERLETAKRTATEPWLYMFVASGGDRRIVGQLDQLVDAVDSALVLGMICIAQMTSRDSGMTTAALAEILVAHCAERFVHSGAFHTALLDSALRDLTARRLIREHDGRIRAAHIRIANHALRDLGQRDTGIVGPTVRRAVRAVLLDEQQEPVGKFWLLRVFERSDSYRGHRARDLVDAEVSTALVGQARIASPGLERGVSLNLIWSSEWLHRLDDRSARQLADMLIDWFPSLVEKELNGLRWSLSGLRSFHKPEFDRVQRSVPAGVLARRLSETISRTAAMEWADVITEFRQVEDPEELQRWDAEFATLIDGNRVAEALSQRNPQSHPMELYDLIADLASIAPAAADLVLRACSDEIREAIETDFARASVNFSHWVFGGMTYVAWLADAPSAPEHPFTDKQLTEARERANPETLALSATSLSVMQGVNWAAAARSLEKTTKLYQLDGVDLMLAWLGYLSSEITDQIAESISKDWLRSLAIEERATEGSRQNLHLTSRLLDILSGGPRGHAVVRAYLEEHLDEFAPFPAKLIASQPELAVRFINEGKELEVPGQTGIDWDHAHRALQAVAALDTDAARRWLREMRTSMVRGLTYEHHDVEGFGGFSLVADNLDPTVLESAFEEIGVEAAERIWPTLVDRKPEDAQALLTRASQTNTSIGKLAARIIADVSSAAVPDGSSPELSGA